jgi:cell division protein FtsL
MATKPAGIPEVRRALRPVSLFCGAAGRAQLREFLFEKSIDNSRLYREVDPEKHRQCFTLLGMVGLVFVFVFFFAWEQFRCVRFGYEIQQLKAQRSGLMVWNERLHLDQALLADPQRIDRLARADLGLAPPASGQIVRLDGAASRVRFSIAPVLAHNFDALTLATRGNPREP